MARSARSSLSAFPTRSLASEPSSEWLRHRLTTVFSPEDDAPRPRTPRSLQRPPRPMQACCQRLPLPMSTQAGKMQQVWNRPLVSKPSSECLRHRLTSVSPSLTMASTFEAVVLLPSFPTPRFDIRRSSYTKGYLLDWFAGRNSKVCPDPLDRPQNSDVHRGGRTVP